MSTQPGSPGYGYAERRVDPIHYGSYLKEQAYKHLSIALFLSFFAVGIMVLAFPNPADAIPLYGIGAMVEFGIIMILFFSAIFGKQFSESTATIILNVFAVATGITLGFMVNIALGLNPMIVVYTFGVAGITIFSIYAYTSINKPDTSALQRRVMVFAILFMIVAFIGIFIWSNSPIFWLIFSGAGALLFAVFMYIDFARLERQEFNSPAMMALWLFYDIIFFIKYLLMFFMHLMGDR